MPLTKLDNTILPATADFHVHLRSGAMMDAVVPCIRQGGASVVYVMPNLSPPITTVQQALSYRAELQALAPDVLFLMTLYLHSSITPATIVEAKRAGIAGVKMYPAGVTTGSDAGVVDLEPFYPVFAEMERQDLVLNLHGEMPSSSSAEITVLNAEREFLGKLADLHARFPRLRIVLEHCTTQDAVEAVRACGETVAATITAHHLFLTIDDWAGNPFNFCKPVAKTPRDRAALLRAAVRGNDGKFFLGTDSAPHDVSAKRGGADGRACTAAGVFTQPYSTGLVLSALEKGVEEGIIVEEDVTLAALEGFLNRWGSRFYGLVDDKQEKIRISRGSERIAEAVKGDGVEIVPFRTGEIVWSVEWVV